jgi:hypothetical protein
MQESDIQNGSQDVRNAERHSYPYLEMNSRSALQAYLSERGNRWSNIKQATEDLLRAGVKVGMKEGREERALRIMISNNLRIFEYDCDRDVKRPEKVRLRFR